MIVSEKADEEFRLNNFYSPVCSSGYLTPLQRKKLREIRNLPLSPDFQKELETPNGKKTKSKGIKKAKDKNASKLKSKEKVIKTMVVNKNFKENSPHLQYSVAGLIGTSKSLDGKEKRFFKSRSPQHLQKAKFVMPLTYKKKRLDFGSEKLANSTEVTPARKNSSKKSNEALNSGNVETVSESDVHSNKREKKAVLTSGEDIDCDIDDTTNGVVGKLKRSSLESKLTIIHLSKKPENAECKSRLNSGNEETDGLSPFDFDWPTDEELLKRRDKARALFKDSISFKTSDDARESAKDAKQSSTPKMYPIFSKMQWTENETKKPKGKRSAPSIMDTSKGDEQMIIDAGQREIGAKLCKTCGMIYCIGQEEDEKLHSGYHTTFLINLKFPGWKKENVVGIYGDGRIIQVGETDKNFKLKKIQDILFIVNRDLGFPTAGLPVRPNVMFLLFISTEKRVGGCLVAESIDSACPVISGKTSQEVGVDGKTIWKLGSWYASSKTVHAICGVNRIWVSHEFRRCKVASRMVDCLRSTFLYGHFVGLHELAFTDPSPDGREFASAYTGTDNFLVYK